MARSLVHALALLAALTALTPSVAEAAEDWGAAFPEDTVATHIEGEAVKIVVVGAGEGSEELSAAVAALSASLEAADAVEVVMDASSLGDVSSMDDAAIVGKAGALPVDRVVIVRVFAGKSGHTGAVSMYTKDGETAGGFSGSQTQPAKANAGTESASASSAAVGAVMASATMDKDKALEEFLQRVVWFQGGNLVSTQTGAVVGKWTQAYKGKYKEELSTVGFYEYIGNAEAVETYKAKRTRRKAISGGLMLGGTIAAIVGFRKIGDIGASDSEFGTGLAVGTVGTLVASYSFYALVAPTPDPYKESERRRMAEEFNRGLLEELGLTEDDLKALSAPVRPAGPSVRLSGGLAPTPGGAAAVLGIQF